MQSDLNRIYRKGGLGASTELFDPCFFGKVVLMNPIFLPLLKSSISMNSLHVHFLQKQSISSYLAIPNVTAIWQINPVVWIHDLRKACFNSSIGKRCGTKKESDIPSFLWDWNILKKMSRIRVFLLPEGLVSDQFKWLRHIVLVENQMWLLLYWLHFVCKFECHEM